MAPEVQNSRWTRDYDESCDIFSLGIVLHQLYISFSLYFLKINRKEAYPNLKQYRARISHKLELEKI